MNCQAPGTFLVFGACCFKLEKLVITMAEHPQISLRKATLDDLPVLQMWDQQAHVIAADPDGQWPWEEELIREVPWREQFIADLAGTPLGFIQINDPPLEETRVWLWYRNDESSAGTLFCQSKRYCGFD